MSVNMHFDLNLITHRLPEYYMRHRAALTFPSRANYSTNQFKNYTLDNENTVEANEVTRSGRKRNQDARADQQPSHSVDTICMLKLDLWLFWSRWSRPALLIDNGPSHYDFGVGDRAVRYEAYAAMSRTFKSSYSTYHRGIVQDAGCGRSNQIHLYYRR